MSNEITSNSRLLTKQDIMEILHVCENTATKIMNTPGFPKISIGHNVRCYEDSFHAWLRKYEGKKIDLR